MRHFNTQQPMTTQSIIKTYIVAMFMTSCGKIDSSNNFNQQLSEVFQIDVLNIAILPFSAIYSSESYKPTSLTLEDLQKTDSLLRLCISDYNPEQEKEFKEMSHKYPESELDKNNFTIDLKRYKRQYIGTTNSHGEKIVWVNCLCDNMELNWRKQLIIPYDGGNCYFHLKINLTTEEYLELRVNGHA